ncbi:hypothetical protein [Chryseosolibacter indicus]|uniref:ABC transporter ATPase n=1 Tax=Chryseosolibacter indicus TaxID=2782351 RepID=A0ABS5VRX6_9BACT|nr:hypothetical protein [Chryseosolibacter indicus]MBT1704185.1 hypothetical protein [Chryseosolibacter indicus]
MFIPFDSISPSSKIWIFQSAMPFTTVQKNNVSNYLLEFTQQWNAHGHELKSSFKIAFDHFIILAVDESYIATSGCSVDESVRAIKTVEATNGLDLFDRNKIAFLEGEQVFFVKVSELKEKFKSNTLKESTLAFNNLISTKQDLDTLWLVPAGNTWLKRYIPKETVNT